MNPPADPTGVHPPGPGAARRRATIRDVARAAGVNPSTVSRVLNGRAAFQVSDDVRRRVLEASESLGYEPSRFARALRTRRSYMLALAVPNVADPFFSLMFQGAARAAEREGYTLVLTDQGGLERAARRTSDFDGLLIATARRRDPLLTRLRSQGVAFVLVNRRSEEGAHPTVRSDDRAGSGLAVDHLVALGHRRIAHLGGNEAYSTAYDRRQGYRAAMAWHGLEVDPRWLVEAGFTAEEGARAADALLALDPAVRPTAVVAVNDLAAVGLLTRARERGLELPRDLSVTGFDDVPMARYVHPALTTVAVAAEEIGRVAVESLLDGARGGEVVLPVRLIPRASTAPPPGPAP
jgi:LacI family transcriptional regulator